MIYSYYKIKFRYISENLDYQWKLIKCKIKIFEWKLMLILSKAFVHF